jgi:endonuclease YncB( thermonuclease family)
MTPRAGRLGSVRRSRPLKLLLVAAALAFAFIAPARAACGTPSGTARVVGVDERLTIALEDGRLVRLAGLDAPDPARGGRTAEAARQFLVSQLVGRDVELRLLATGTDRWGRVLADLSTAQGGCGGSVAAALLSAGYARVRPEFETRGCAAARLAIEDGTRGAGLGLWGEPDTAVIQATDAVSLRSRDGQFVVVEGRVRRVGFGRSRLYLDLVPRDGPTIVIPRKLQSALAEAGRPVEGLAGVTIRARGTLDDRVGPRIEVSEAAMIEIVHRASAPGAEQPRQ